MPQQAFTFVPDVSINEAGQETFTGEGTLQPQRSGGTYETPYEINDQTGQREYNITEQDYQQDGDHIPLDVEAEYVETILQLYPDYSNATQYAIDNWSPQRLERFNKAIDVFDMSDAMPLIEEMMSEYRSAVEDGLPEVAPEEEEVELPSDEEIYSAYDEGLTTEAGGTEVAMDWLNLAVETEGNDPVMSDIARLSADFHKGQITAEDAWVSAINNHSMAELQRVFKYLTN